MTTTKKIVIGILVLAVTLGVVFWFLSQRNTTGNNVSQGNFSVKDFWPFGKEDDGSPLDGENDSNNVGSGNGSNTSNNGDVTGGTGSNNGDGFSNTGGSLSKLRKIYDKPVAGAVLLTDKATTTTIRFVEKSTGNVYEAYSDSTVIKRLTNETIPAIYRAMWLLDGSGFIAQKSTENDFIETSFIKLQKSATTTAGSLYETVVSKLPSGIMEVATSPDSKKIFYLVKDSGSKGFVSNPDGTNKVEVLNSFLSEWIPEWFSTNSILLKSKASEGEESFGFFLNPTTKSSTKAYSSIWGGTALGRNGSDLLLLSTGGESPRLFTQDKEMVRVDLNKTTVTEKCAWDKVDPKFIYCGVPKNITGSWPDSWYRGETATSDYIHKINVFDVYNYVLSDLESESREKIDVINIQISKDSKYSVFQNKIDESLWILEN